MSRVIILIYLLGLTITLFGENDKRMLLEISPIIAMEKIDFTPGLSLKVKSPLYSGDHFDIKIGGQLIYCREFIGEDESLYNQISGVYIEGISGYSQHLVFDIITEFLWSPILNTKLSIGIEPYLGYSLFSSEGQVELPELDINESFSTDFHYFDYGLSPLVKYRLQNMEIGLSLYFPLKYYMDYLFDTEMDGKNTMYLGFSFGYLIL